MSQRSIEDLIKWPKGFDPAKAAKPAGKTHGFETATYAQTQDQIRARMLVAVAQTLPECPDRSQMEKLAADLDGAAVPATCASSRFMRQRRRAVIGHLWEAMQRVKTTPWGTVTVMVRGWQIAHDDLHLIDPRRLLEQFRADLYRCGLSKADGCAFFNLHGEYNSATGMFDLHIHGVYSGGIAPVLQRLSKRPKYKPAVIELDGARKVVNRVKVSKRAMEGMPYPITYVLQSWWPMRYTFVAGGKVKRTGRKRIPHFPHAKWLLWMDRWTVSDLTLMVRMRVTKQGLVQAVRRTPMSRGMAERAGK